MSSLSQRGRYMRNYPKMMESIRMKVHKNQYHKTANPEGIINLGTSENKIVFDLLSDKFNENSVQSFSEEYTCYNLHHGMKSFREGLAEFLEHYMKPAQKVDPENLIVLNGCGSVLETLGAVISDPGEGILVPAPLYGGFCADLEQRTRIVPFPVETSSKPDDGELKPFELSVMQLEKALESAKQQGVTIRALLLCNPNNPLGAVYSEETVRECMQFASRHSLHLILDEIYMLSVFKEGFQMKCALSFEDIPDRDRLHVIWGFSKDFGVSGFRCGVLHTWNKDVLSAIKAAAAFQAVSVPIQHLMMQLIKDRDWLDNVYIPTYHRRLRERHKVMCDSLRDSGIPFLDRESGLYVWANFGELMCSPTFSDELALFERFLDAGVNINPGQAFRCSEPGWFRLVFSVDLTDLQVAMGRLSACIQDIRREIGPMEATSAFHLEVSGSGLTQSRACADNGACPTDTLEDLVRCLSDQIQNSDWLQQNTAEKWAQENPELARAFMDEQSRTDEPSTS